MSLTAQSGSVQDGTPLSEHARVRLPSMVHAWREFDLADDESERLAAVMATVADLHHNVLRVRKMQAHDTDVLRQELRAVL